MLCMEGSSPKLHFDHLTLRLSCRNEDQEFRRAIAPRKFENGPMCRRRRRLERFRLANHMVGAEGAPALGLVIRISGRTTPPALVR